MRLLHLLVGIYGAGAGGDYKRGEVFLIHGGMQLLSFKIKWDA